MHLAEYLTAPDRRPQVVADACVLIDRQVSDLRGVSGLAIRSAHRVLTGVRPGMVATAVDGLLAPFCDELDPYYQEHVSRGVPLAQVLVEQRTSMAEGLLSITDDRADRSSNRTLRRAYQRVRGSARQQVEAAAPGIAELIAAHVPGPDGVAG